MASRCTTSARSQRCSAISFSRWWKGTVHLEIACARNAEERGSQVSLRHPHGYAIMRALIDKGVVGDFRAPDVLRFGLAPLYTRYVDIWDATDQLRAVMTEGAWRDERYRIQATVT